MDWLRIGAFGLLILFHVGIMFAPWNFPKEVRGDFEWVTIPLIFTNSWRLSLLFAISGYASAALLARENGVGEFLRSRMARLGIPLLFGIVFIVSPQPYSELLKHSDYPHSFFYFLTHDFFTFGKVNGVMVPTWMHLWFVVYLLAYTFVLGAVWSLPDAVRTKARRWAERALAGWGLLPLGMAFVYFARLIPPGWSDTRGFIDDPSAHVVYLTTFLFGVLLRRSEAVRAAIHMQWKIALVLGLLGYVVVASYDAIYHGTWRIPKEGQTPFLIARAVQSWGMIIALFGIADTYWNRDGKWRATLAEAVFPFYIVHQTIIFLFGFWVSKFQLGAPVEFVLMIVVTVVGCWIFYLVGREIGPLRPLIGLKREKPQRRPPAVEPIPAE